MAQRGRPKKRGTRDDLTARSGGSSADPIRDLLEDETAEQDLVRLVRDMLPYQSFLMVKPPLEVRTYRSLRNLAALSELFHIDEDDICRRLQITPVAISKLKAEPHYELMCQRVRGVVETLANPRRVAEWATDMEDRLTMRLVQTALWDGSTRDRVQAQNALLDRVSAKRGREDEARDPGMPQLPSDMLKMMQMVASVTAASVRSVMVGDGQIDGSILNVPKFIGSGVAHPEEGE